jgi:hypothetical protein
MAIEAFHKVTAEQAHGIRAEWFYGICDNFIVKQTPTLVTWGLSLVYAGKVSPTADYQLDVRAGGELGHNLRYVASAVSHVFIASGEVLQLFKRFQKLSGYAQRVTELEDVLLSLQHLKVESGSQVSWPHGKFVARGCRGFAALASSYRAPNPLSSSLMRILCALRTQVWWPRTAVA